MIRRLRPQEHLTDEDVRRGIRMLTYDGIMSQVMATLVGGAFLVAFALHAGASNKVIGLLAAVGPLTQLAQLPAIALINRIRLRKAMAYWGALGSRLVWLPIAALPWLAPAPYRLPALVSLLALSSLLGTVSGAAWNPWMRDFVPESAMGAIFGRRLAIATATSAAVGLLAGLAVDRLSDRLAEPIGAYSLVFLAGAAAGLAGVHFLSCIPEPAMRPARPRPLRDILGEPLRDRNYRNLIRFLGVWNLAVNLAAPFFVVYMLRRLGLSMAVVVGLSVVSQGVNALSLRLWGRLADRFSNKSVLSVSGSLFLLTFLLWPFAGLPQAGALSLPVVALIHVLAGLSTAGVTLCSGTIALKIAPRGEATAFLATNAIWSGAMSAAAPLLAGVLADWFVTQQIQISLRWFSTAGVGRDLVLTPIDLRGLDFLFILAFLVGLYAMHRLLAVNEAGAVKERVVVMEFYAEVRRGLQHISNIGPLRQLTDFPFMLLASLLPERRRRPRRRGDRGSPPDDDRVPEPAGTPEGVGAGER